MLKCIITFTLFLSILFSQNTFEFTNYNTKHGLLHNSVVSMGEDSKGFLWFANLDGLSRFDGEHFENFRPNRSDSIMLNTKFNHIHFIDNKDRIWLNGHTQGWQVFDLKHAKFYDVPYGGNNILPVQNQTNGFDLIGRNVFIELDSNLNKVRSFRYNENLNATKENTYYVQAVYGSRAYTTFGLKVYITDLRTLSVDSLNIESEGSKKSDIVRIHEDENKNIWIGTYSDGLYIYSRDGHLKYHFKEGFINSSTIFPLNENIYVGTQKGIVVFRDYKIVARIVSEPKIRGSLSSNHITNIYKDSRNMLWVLTYGGGVNVTELSKSEFCLIKKSDETPLSHPFVTGITSSNSELWVGTLSGLNRYNFKERGWTSYITDKLNKNSISHNVIADVFYDQSGLWVSTDGGGLNYFNGKEFKSYSIKDGLNSQHLWKVIVIDDDVWIGNKNDGVNILRNGQFISLKHDREDDSSISGNEIRDIYISSDGYIWVTTERNGINRVHPKTLKAIHYKPLNKNGVLNAFWSVSEDFNGNMWFGSSQDGLLKYTLGMDSIRWFNKEDGLPNNTIYSIQIDGDGFLWFSTNNGLSKFNPETHEVETYKMSDGLQNNEFNKFSSHKDRDGNLYFGGVSGFNKFSPSKISSKKKKTNIVLSSVRIVNEEVYKASETPYKRSHEIEFDDKLISFRFASIGNKGLSFSYTLENQDTEWIHTSKQIASYTNLFEGDYLFKVAVDSRNSKMYSDTLQFHLKVNPPWFRTSWAYTLFLVLITLFALAVKWIIAHWKYIVSPRSKHIAHFKTIQIIGSGSMGKVYEAFDLNKKATVALKVFESEELTDDNKLVSFFKEIELGQILSHSNIIKIFDIGTYEKSNYISMELIKGENLKSLIYSNEEITAEMKKTILLQVLEGLNYIHENNIVHRDLKPSNILLKKDPLHVKISDFGLASSLHLISIDDHSKIVGTMAYMSPEQTLGKAVDARSDLYSFGVIMYELFYYQKPFYAANQMELLYTIHNKNVVFETEDEINSIITKLLSKHPSDRYSSASEVIKELTNIF